MTDLIAAIATPPGRGGVGIVRLSGPGAALRQLAQALIGDLPPPRMASYRDFRGAAHGGRDQGVIDQGLALYFPAPHSFTGEHVLELQGHGGPVVMDLLLERVLDLGARLARAGEFSERAFHNDKIDLAQAESIADLIDSGSRSAARAAQRSLRGVFSTRVNQILEALTELRVYVEAAIDFPDEEIDFLSDGKVEARVMELDAKLEAIEQTASQGQVLRDGMTVVILGQPNAGKSSLLNALSGRQSAIITDQAGTTRDLIRENIELGGIPLHIIDTAGIRESDDAIEREGVRRALEEAANADLVFIVIDSNHGFDANDQGLLDHLPEGVSPILLFNKTDQSGHPPGAMAPVNPRAANQPPIQAFAISAKHQQGLTALSDYVRGLAGLEIAETGLVKGGMNERDEGPFLARRRHLAALSRTREHVATGLHQLRTNHAGELLAEELRLAQQALGEITGVVTADALLGEIFSSFCIGK